jgi:transposase
LIKDIPIEELVYLDECGVEDSCYRAYGRAIIGKKVHGENSGKRADRVSVIAALCQKQLLAPARLNGYTDSNVFNTWLEHFLLPALKPGITVIMDNASIHKTLKTKELFAKAGCNIIFLPPYSPDLNKIEPQWANLKRKLQKLKKHTVSFLDSLDTCLLDMSIP